MRFVEDSPTDFDSISLMVVTKGRWPASLLRFLPLVGEFWRRSDENYVGLIGGSG